MTPGQPGQAWSAELYAANARFVADLAGPVLDMLAPRPGERILDLGCGDGVLSLAIANAGASVLGADFSPDMVRATRALGVEAQVMDGQKLRFTGEFDAVFSNAALHWMPEADAVIAGVARALKKPGGRFVGEFGGHANIASIATALRAVLRQRGIDVDGLVRWFFPTAEHYAGLLARHGFTIESLALIPRPTVLPTGMAGWLTIFAAPFLGGLDRAAHASVLHEMEALLAPSLRDFSGQWIADYVRLRFAARL